MHRCSILAPLALALATPAGTQTPSPQATPSLAEASDPAGAARCEFHVWPGDGIMSTYYGWFHGSTVNGQIQGRPGYPAMPPNPIDTATQRTILTDSQPHGLMSHPDYRLIVHDEALTSRVIRTTPGRLSDSTSNCYAELVVDDVIVQQDWVNGSFLKILFRYRDFGPDAAPRRSFATWAQTHLDTFPPRQPEQLDAAITEIRAAYREDIARFATMALRAAAQRAN